MCLGFIVITSIASCAADSGEEQVAGSTPMVDVSQSIDRLRHRPILEGEPTKLMTLTPGMKVAICDIRPKAPILTGLDTLLVQGLPLSDDAVDFAARFFL